MSRMNIFSGKGCPAVLGAGRDGKLPLGLASELGLARRNLGNLKNLTKILVQTRNLFLVAAVWLACSTGGYAVTVNLTNTQNYSSTPSIGYYDTEVVFNVASGTATISSSFTCFSSGYQYIPFKKTGAGKLIIIGTITTSLGSYGLPVQVQAGTLQIGNGTANGAMSTPQIDISSGATLRYEQANGSTTVPYLISGAGGVEIFKTVSFTNNNTYTGTTTIGSTTAYGDLYLGDNSSAGNIASSSIVITSPTSGTSYLSFRRTTDFTVTGAISGTGVVYKSSNTANKVILTGTNTYTGHTYIGDGTLQVGNGTSGSIANTSYVSVSGTGTILRFEPGAAMVFSKQISGTGSVQVKGTSSKTLTLSYNNAYTGTTTIHPSSYLYIGDNGTTGAIGGNIVDSGRLYFNRSNDYTYSGVISGTGDVYKQGSAKVILTGANTYTGATSVTAGTLQIGDNSGSSINTGSIANTSGIAVSSGAILRFDRSSITIAKVISGAGAVQVKGTVYYTANNTYTGTTTVHSSSSLAIGTSATSTNTSGAVAGNIVDSGTVHFLRSDNYQYTGVISGPGHVDKWNVGNLTLTGVNTYTGNTWSENGGTLTLSSTGSIANSSSVYLIDNGSKLSILGNKTIKALNASTSYTTAEVQLNGNTLTLGNTGQTDGTGTFYGFFSGAGGGVTKAGTGTFTMRGANTATGTFKQDAGTVVFYEQWKGSYTLMGGTLDVRGSVNIGNAGVGTLSMNGGTISMNLTSSASPAKSLINVAGNAGASAVTFSISAAAGNNQTLITAAGGLTSTTPYTFNMPGFTVTPHANTISLTIDVAVTDVTPPTVGGSGVINGTATSESAVNLTWTAANDGSGTPQASLRYYVYRSTSNNISSVANCTSNGILLNPGGSLNLTSYNATGLNPSTTYYFNVVVADLADNRAAYTAKSVTTLAPPDAVPPVPGTGVNGTVSMDTAYLNWTTATDNETAQGDLMYRVYQSLSNNITSVTDCETNGIQITSGKAITAFIAAGLAPDAYYFNVVVADQAGNKAAYTPKTLTILPTEVTNISISPAVINVPPGSTQQFTATVTATGGADESITWSIIGHTSMLTSISATGLLTVGANDIADTLVVIATSEFNKSVSGTAIVIVNGVGIKPIPNSELQVYPNPTNGQLRITNYELREGTVIEIFDIYGKNLTPLTSHSSPLILDISHLANGMYFLKIDGRVVKIIKD